MDKLLKFCSFNINKITFLLSNKIWMSSNESFNDPFDGLISVGIGKHKNKIIQKAVRNALEVYEPDCDYIFEKHDGEILYQYFYWEIEQRNDLRACSFSLDKNGLLNSDYMWSHYSDGLRGFCIVFERIPLIKSLATLNSENFLGALEVKYSEKFPHIDLVDFYSNASMDTEYFPNDESPFTRQIYEKTATKSMSWSLENEFRVISMNTNHLIYDSSAISYVVVGEKMTEDNRNLIFKTMKSIRPNIVFKEARINREKYGIEIVEI